MSVDSSNSSTVKEKTLRRHRTFPGLFTVIIGVLVGIILVAEAIAILADEAGGTKLHYLPAYIITAAALGIGLTIVCLLVSCLVDRNSQSV